MFLHIILQPFPLTISVDGNVNASSLLKKLPQNQALDDILITDDSHFLRRWNRIFTIIRHLRASLAFPGWSHCSTEDSLLRLVLILVNIDPIPFFPIGLGLQKKFACFLIIWYMLHAACAKCLGQEEVRLPTLLNSAF